MENEDGITWIPLPPDPSAVPKPIDMAADVTIGQWADFFRYDPDGLDGGPPTPRNPKLEEQIFGKRIIQEYRKRSVKNGK